jgi:hypothetical protein
MQITVTREDIEGGQRHDPERCPVAKALNRAGILHFGVMLASVVVADGRGHVAGLPLPARVTDWILDFDANRAVAPISFELMVPSSASEKDRMEELLSPDGTRESLRHPTLGRECAVRNRIALPRLVSRRPCSPGLSSAREPRPGIVELSRS